MSNVSEMLRLYEDKVWAEDVAERIKKTRLKTQNESIKKSQEKVKNGDSNDK